MIRTRHLAIAACLVLAACSSETAPPTEGTAAASKNESTPAAPVEMVEAVSSDKFSVNPRSVTQCDPASEVTVSWNYPELPADSKLELYVDSDGSEKLFAVSINMDTAKTGPWARPGTRFVLKSESTKEVVAEAVVGGPRC